MKQHCSVAREDPPHNTIFHEQCLLTAWILRPHQLKETYGPSKASWSTLLSFACLAQTSGCLFLAPASLVLPYPACVQGCTRWCGHVLSFSMAPPQLSHVMCSVLIQKPGLMSWSAFATPSSPRMHNFCCYADGFSRANVWLAVSCRVDEWLYAVRSLFVKQGDLWICPPSTATVEHPTVCFRHCSLHLDSAIAKRLSYAPECQHACQLVPSLNADSKGVAAALHALSLSVAPSHSWGQTQDYVCLRGPCLACLALVSVSGFVSLSCCGSDVADALLPRFVFLLSPQVPRKKTSLTSLSPRDFADESSQLEGVDDALGHMWATVPPQLLVCLAKNPHAPLSPSVDGSSGCGAVAHLILARSCWGRQRWNSLCHWPVACWRSPCASASVSMVSAGSLQAGRCLTKAGYNKVISMTIRAVPCSW